MDTNKRAVSRDTSHCLGIVRRQRCRKHASLKSSTVTEFSELNFLKMFAIDRCNGSVDVSSVFLSSHCYGRVQNNISVSKENWFVFVIP